MSIVKEFQDFIARGNAVDLAVGLIMGAAFTKIVSSIVSDLVMPPIGWLIGGVDFKNLQFVIEEAKVDPVTKLPVAEVAIRYGAFINVVIEFFIIALSVFLVIKLMNAMMAYREKYIPLGGGDEEPPAGEEPAKS